MFDIYSKPPSTFNWTVTVLLLQYQMKGGYIMEYPRKLDFEVIIQYPICGWITKVLVNLNDYLKWQNGASIQNVMPYLTVSEREYLITGFCADCQNDFWDEDALVD